MFGDSGETLYRELHTLLRHPKTAAKLRADIAMFLIERLHGKAPQHVDIEAGGTGGGPIVFEVITNVPQPAERRDAD
jgi:hypothetical protein